MPTAFEMAQRAEVMATTANTRIGSHELECSRRYGEVASQFREIRESLDDMKEASNKRFRAQVGGILTILGMGLVQVVLKLWHVG